MSAVRSQVGVLPSPRSSSEKKDPGLRVFSGYSCVPIFIRGGLVIGHLQSAVSSKLKRRGSSMRIRKSDTCSACRFRHGTSRRNRKSAACQPCRLRPGVSQDAWKTTFHCKVKWLVDILLSCHKPKFSFTGSELRTQHNEKASNLGLRIYATPLRLKPLLTTLRVVFSRFCSC